MSIPHSLVYIHVKLNMPSTLRSFADHKIWQFPDHGLTTTLQLTGRSADRFCQLSQRSAL